MSVKPRTVDDLGIDAHQAYAASQERYIPSFSEDAKIVFPQTEIGVFLPYFPDLESWLGIRRKSSPWSLFTLPKKPPANPKSLFSYQVMPSLGIKEALLLLLSTVKEVKIPIEALPKQKEELSRKQTVLEKFLRTILELDSQINTANAQRGRYHKG